MIHDGRLIVKKVAQEANLLIIQRINSKNLINKSVVDRRNGYRLKRLIGDFGTLGSVDTVKEHWE